MPTIKKSDLKWRVKEGITISFKLPGDDKETHWQEGDIIVSSDFALPTWERLIERELVEAIDG